MNKQTIIEALVRIGYNRAGLLECTENKLIVIAKREGIL